MFARLLLVVLMLAGPLPVRVCTCAASPTTCTDPGCPAAPARSPERMTCGCGHSHHQEPAGESDGEVAGDWGRAAHMPAGVAHQHPPDHHPACPAAQVRAAPQPLLPSAPVQSSDADVLATTLPEPVPSLPTTATATHVRDRAPARPLFITLLTLRN